MGCYDFLEFGVESRNGTVEVERLTVWQALVEALVATVAICLTERETQRGQWKELYADAQENMLEVAMEQLIANVRMLCSTRQ